jgi:hypothetical protein
VSNTTGPRRAIGSRIAVLARDAAQVACSIVPPLLTVSLVWVPPCGHYYHLTRREAIAALLEAQLELWGEIRALGDDLARRLARVAGT